MERLRRYYKEKKKNSHLREIYTSGFNARKTKGPLESLCELHGSDKSWPIDSQVNPPFDWPSKDYGQVYDLIWNHSRQNVYTVMELGIGSNNPSAIGFMGENYRIGASLRVWRDYFPNAQIFGVDIDPQLLISENRIKTFHADQTSRSSLRLLKDYLGPLEIDFIVDDGLHEAKANITFFEEMFELLKPNGYYSIEDIHVKELGALTNYFETGKYSFSIFSFYSQGKNLYDNNLLLVQGN